MKDETVKGKLKSDIRKKIEAGDFTTALALMLALIEVIELEQK